MAGEGAAAKTVRAFRARHGRHAALASAVVFAALVGLNAFSAVRIQDELRPEQRFHVSPRDIALAAAEHRHPRVQGYLAILHLLDQRLAGATISVPRSSWLALYVWELERISRLRVVLTDEVYRLRPRHVRRLRKAGAVKRWFWRDGGDEGEDRREKFFLLTQKRAREYTVAETKQGDLFLLPTARMLALKPKVRTR